MTTTAITVHQTARPDGFPTPDLFRLVESPVPAPEPGTALVENLFLSVDPYHRELMDEDGGWALDAPLEGRTLARVVASRDPQLREGDLVFHRHGWRTHALVTLGEHGTRKITSYPGVPLHAHLGILGGTGLTAYVALTRFLELTELDDLFISAAAGGVGSAAARIARLLGVRRLVGSAGTPVKVRHLTEHLGFDAAFNYHDGPLPDLLAKAAPDGISTYLDNVGGDHLEAAIGALRDHGRIAWVGAIAQYHSAATPPPAPRNLFDIVGKSLRLEGVRVRDFTPVQQELEDLLVPHLRSGTVTSDATIVRGIEHTVGAFLGMLRGENLGKMLVALEPAG
ncbi:MDR family NADP-dependent oxidoreductase [Streptomyces avicenniae]|uniref:MDR family NADP-dependent oxidoreductase n=1 Tax=Streptomyces avicenniae TaxID=500153 RepID=UPI000699700D|nr:NADP-dependent oxidoreductase [Streptomyces avicenniae]